MTSLAQNQELCRSFAALFGYPGHDLQAAAVDCAVRLQRLDSAAAEPMASFAASLQGRSSSGLEELYTSTFDLQPACHPYVGYLLFGEGQQRTLFLIRLQQLYRQHGYNACSELPDHLTTLLEFIGSLGDQDCAQELLRDGLLPALDKLSADLDATDNPYLSLIEAVQHFLKETAAAVPEPLMADGRRS